MDISIGHYRELEAQKMKINASQTKSLWTDDDWVKNFLANQLLKGRLSLVLGAGICADLELPSWNKLIDDLYLAKCKVRDVNHTNELAAENLLINEFDNDRIAFAKEIRNQLFLQINSNPSRIESSPLLSALGAMVMASARGKVSNVVTFNFDDLLEEYLEARGFAVRAINSLPCWNDYGDVTVLHPHGILSRNLITPITRGVILTSHDFATIIGKESDLWRQKVTDIFRSNTCLFLGLSGQDMNLTNMLQDANQLHTSHVDNDAYWGIRLSIANDPMKSFWEHRGVCNFELPAYKNIPNWLFDICRLAAKKRNI